MYEPLLNEAFIAIRMQGQLVRLGQLHLPRFSNHGPVPLDVEALESSRRFTKWIHTDTVSLESMFSLTIPIFISKSIR